MILKLCRNVHAAKNLKNSGKKRSQTFHCTDCEKMLKKPTPICAVVNRKQENQKLIHLFLPLNYLDQISAQHSLKPWGGGISYVLAKGRLCHAGEIFTPHNKILLKRNPIFQMKTTK